jgi:hypothetical protein
MLVFKFSEYTKWFVVEQGVVECLFLAACVIFGSVAYVQVLIASSA